MDAWPATRRAAFTPARSPLAVEPTYPSVPTICPAKNSRGSDRQAILGSSSAGAFRKVLRCICPNRTQSARSKPGIRPKTRRCSSHLRLVWKPTRLYREPARLSCRNWTTAYGLRPVLGSIRPTGRSGPNARASRPRLASTSMGKQASKNRLSSCSKR